MEFAWVKRISGAIAQQIIILTLFVVKKLGPE